jgi:hypothetical protein
MPGAGPGRWRSSRRVEVADESMRPTLAPGDRLRVDPRAYRDRPPRVGEIVVAIDPEAADRWLVKRVAAVGPGRFWHLPGQLVPAAPEGAADRPADAGELLELGADDVYLLSDAPLGGRDSRRFGPVRRATLIGRVTERYSPVERAGPL